MTKKETEIAKAEQTGLTARFPVLDPKSDAAAVIRCNMGEEDITPGDLVRVKVPSGGGSLWEVPTIHGAEGAKELKGILINLQRRRAYWPGSDPTNDAPQCSSVDMKIGKGDPGGECDACPLNEWGSAVNDKGEETRGKACKETVLAFLLREGDKLPIVVSFPPGSLKDFKSWRLQLPVPYYFAEVSLTLDVDKNDAGTAYSKIHTSLVRVLEEDERENVVDYVETMQAMFSKVTE